MKNQLFLVLGALGFLSSGCQKSNTQSDVISQRYIHKYGYAVSKEEWESRNYPGQVITNLRNGVTVTATYENGILHGPCTHTYCNSQMVESYYLYNQGNAVKEILYDIRGMPIRENVQLSPTRYTTTLWYADGTPMSLEEFANEELLEAQYLSVSNETEARVEKGNGLRIRRTQDGVLISKDQIQSGYMVKREGFYPNGAPENISYYSDGKLQGEKRTFAQNGGEPLVIEEYIKGQLHGKATYFKNGTRYLEISYLDGLKNGSEVHYLDGEQISQEIQWENDKKHGPTTYYVSGGTRIEYYYDGRLVTQDVYDELYRRDEMTSNISLDVRWNGQRN
jgi:antitoxin component YwqK of YwqJK toxin-antitoxin module